MTNVILCACPDEAIAKELSLQLVKKKLAACVNIIPHVQSVFFWNNQIEETKEVLLMIKASQKNYEKIEAFIQSMHPYEVPEIIALTISQGSSRYLEWVNQ